MEKIRFALWKYGMLGLALIYLIMYLIVSNTFLTLVDFQIDRNGSLIIILAGATSTFCWFVEWLVYPEKRGTFRQWKLRQRTSK